MLTPAEAKKIKSMPEWDALESHLRDCVRALNAVSHIPDDANFEKVARGTQYAILLVESILAPFDIEDLTDDDGRSEMLEKLGLSTVDEN